MKMDQKLYEATIEGKVDTLLKLIQEDALTLDRNITTPYLETPLHIAAMLGHEQFVVELLKRKPELTKELDSQRSSPLHFAAAKGHVGVIKLLVHVNPDMCLVCDKDGRNPVHTAAMRGRIDALKELFDTRPDAGRALVSGGVNRTTSILHLCVEYGQFEALKLLIGTGEFQDLVNCKDKNGNTILHLAVAYKQTETTDFLLAVSGIESNTMNHSGMTAMDILMQKGSDARDIILEESLTRARVFGAKRNNDAPNHMNPNAVTTQEAATLRKSKGNTLSEQPGDWLDKKRSALMVVASLIATMAFQVGVSPPHGVFDDTNTTNLQENFTVDSNRVHYYTTTTYNFLKKHAQFYMINTTGFIASLSIILLLMSGLPLKHRFFMWILMVYTWVAITAIALSYTISIIIQTPPGQEDSIVPLIGITVLVWICLMALLLFGHTARLIFRMIKLVLRPLTKRRKIPVYNGRV